MMKLFQIIITLIIPLLNGCFTKEDYELQQFFKYQEKQIYRQEEISRWSRTEMEANKQRYLNGEIGHRAFLKNQDVIAAEATRLHDEMLWTDPRAYFQE